MPSTNHFHIGQMEKYWSRIVLAIAAITAALSLHYLLYRLYDQHRSLSAGVDRSLEMVDRGFIAGCDVMDDQNEYLLVQVEKEAEHDLSRYQPVVEAAREVRRISGDLTAYLDEVRNDLLEEAGRNTQKSSVHIPFYFPKGTARMLLVDREKGNEITQRVCDARRAFLEAVVALKGTEGTVINDETLAQLEREIPLGTAGTCASKKDGRSANVLSEMPLAAVLPVLSKFQYEIKTSEAAVLLYLMYQISGGCRWVVDDFVPVASPRKSQVAVGESFETEVFLAASSRSLYPAMEVTVNGQPVEVEYGIAKYTARPKSEGVKNYQVDITIDHPVSGDRRTYSRTFTYEVGRCRSAVEIDQR